MTHALKFGLIGLGVLIMLLGTVSASPQCVNPSDTSLSVLGVAWGNLTHPAAPGPGNMDVPLTVTLQSSGSDCQMENVQGVLEMYQVNVNGVQTFTGVLSNFNGSDQGVVNAQSQAGYSDFNLVFNLNLAKNFTTGQDVVITDPLYVYWTYGDNVSGRASQEFNLNIPLRGSPDLVFNAQGASLIAGQTNNITVQVSNLGTGQATGINIPFPSSSGVELLSQPQQINTLLPGQTANISISAFVPPSLAGQDLALNPYYDNPYGYNTTLTGGLSLYVLPSEGTLNVSASTDTLTAGRVDNIWLNLTNYGTQDVKDLVVTVTPSSSMSLLGSDGVIDVPVIPTMAGVSIPLSLYPTSSGSTATLGVTLNSASGSISRTLSFLTPGYVNLTVVSSTVLPSVPQPGQIFSLTSTLDNLGSVTAQAVSVTPIPPAGITILGQSTTFVGSMGVYTPTAFTLSFTSSSTTSAGVYRIPVMVQYVNNVDQQVSTVIYYTVGIGESAAVTAVTGNTVAPPSGGFGTGNFIRRNFTGNFVGGGGFAARNGSSTGAASGNAEAGQHTTTQQKSGGVQPGYVDLAAIGIVIIVVVAGTWALMRRRGKEKERPTKAHHA